MVSANQALGVGGVELGRFDQSLGGGGSFVARLGADKEIVFRPEGGGAHVAFGDVIIQFWDAVVEAGAQTPYPGAEHSKWWLRAEVSPRPW